MGFRGKQIMLDQDCTRSAIVAIAAGLYCLMPSNTLAQPASPSFTMNPAEPVFQPQVIGPNSRAANPANWPVTFVFRSAPNRACTATAIGPQAILTAAHCIPDAATGTIETGQSAVAVTCRHHPRYPADISADFSLCQLATPLPAPVEGFEVVNVNPSSTALGKPITLLGFGCLTQGGTDGSFGRLFEGDTQVISVENNDYIVTGGGAAVCFGDSGGGAYVTLDSFGLQRRLVAVNSRGDISDYSWLSVTASPLFIDWAKAWSANRGVAICGLDAGAQHCRQ
jgi:hypothetical protein